jgi:hypothetical protein
LTVDARRSSGAQAVPPVPAGHARGSQAPVVHQHQTLSPGRPPTAPWRSPRSKLAWSSVCSGGVWWHAVAAPSPHPTRACCHNPHACSLSLHIHPENRSHTVIRATTRSLPGLRPREGQEPEEDQDHSSMLTVGRGDGGRRGARRCPPHAAAASCAKRTPLRVEQSSVGQEAGRASAASASRAQRQPRAARPLPASPPHPVGQRRQQAAGRGP